jgi:hypothetical protein
VAACSSGLGAVKPRVTGVGCANAMWCTTESTCLGLGASSAPRRAPLGVLCPSSESPSPPCVPFATQGVAPQPPTTMRRGYVADMGFQLAPLRVVFAPMFPLST